VPINADSENHALMVDDLASFTQNEMYPRFRDALRLEREEILNEGKKSRDPHILSKLDGFDQAATIFERARAIVVERNKPSTEDSDDQPDY
jgi:hypothetical protein